MLLIFISPRAVFAQTPAPFNFQRAYQDFVFNYDLYKTAENEYELARAQYMQSKTLAAQAKAQEATYKMLQARDEVIKTYFTALRQRINEGIGISQDRKEVLYQKIDIEVEWYNQHKQSTSSAASLEDLSTDSNKARDRYRNITESIAYEILTEIAIGKEYFLRQKQTVIMDELRTKLAEIRANGDLPTDIMERDLLEVENRQARSIAKEEEARKIQTVELPKAKQKAAGFYDTIIFRITEAVQYLKEANTYLKEIVQRIKRS